MHQKSSNRLVSTEKDVPVVEMKIFSACHRVGNHKYVIILWSYEAR